MTQEKSKMEFFLTIANSLKPLVIITKNSTSDVAEVLDRSSIENQCERLIYIFSKINFK